jgi:hypothetical protein
MTEGQVFRGWWVDPVAALASADAGEPRNGRGEGCLRTVQSAPGFDPKNAPGDSAYRGLLQGMAP